MSTKDKNISNQKIQNWGNYPSLNAEIFSPDKLDELPGYLKEKEALLARGNGRCYGDAALAKNIISTLSLDKIISFDETTGIIECESGVLFQNIISRIVPAGFFLPVTPGTKFITVGGAIAADIHGKNHHKEGCFSQYVLSFDLMTEDGKILTCSHNQNKELFGYTIGGMGWTGIILSAKFSLKKIETAFIRQEKIPANSLEEVMDLFEASQDWTYTMAWVDILQSGSKLGRSVLFRGEHAKKEELNSKQIKDPLRLSSSLKLNVPFHFPSFVLNPFTVKVFNFLYYKKQGQAKNAIVHFDPFFYPLDSIHNWNRIYGNNGFTQYQLLLPTGQSKEGLKEVLSCIQSYKQGSFLSVLKLFGSKNQLAPNSFPEKGYTLSLDFKINSSTPKLVAALDHIVSSYGGKIYLAKDAFSSAEMSKFDFSKSSDKFDSLLKQRIKPK